MASTSIGTYKTELLGYPATQRYVAAGAVNAIEQRLPLGFTVPQARDIVMNEPNRAQRARVVGVLAELQALATA